MAAPRLARRRISPTPEQAAWIEPTGVGGAIVASAARVDIAATASRRKAKAEDEWQSEVWRHYDRCGELQAAALWMANSLSRLRIYAAEIGPDGRPGNPTDNAVAQRIAAQLFGGPGSASQVLGALGVHLTVPGDCYIVSEEDPSSPVDDWYVVSTSELVKKSGKLGIDRGDGWRALNEETSVLIRVWNPHPRRREEATSAARSVLPVLRELEKLDQHMIATLESRLAGAGILLLPDKLSFKAASPEAAAANANHDPFLVMLTEAMMTAVEDRESPAALVPIVAKVPEEALGKAQHLTFGSEINKYVQQAREECIRRLALGLDLPPEVLLGQADSNHWSAWQVAEDGIKVHVEPKALTVVTALTEEYFRPALKAAGVPNPERFVLWYDASELVLRPNRAETAKTLYDADAISLRVLLRESGFDPDADQQTPEEFRVSTLLSLLAKQPDFAAGILPALGITGVAIPLMQPRPPEQAPGHTPGPTEEDPGSGDTPAPSDGDSGTPATDPGGDDGGTPAQSSAGDVSLRLAQEVAVEQLVSRGLEYANKKLLTRGRRGTFDGDIRAFYLDPSIAVQRGDVPRLLDGAWAYLEETADAVALDPDRLRHALADHVGGLLVTGQPHDRRYSRTIVGSCG